MSIRILYFGPLKEITQQGEEHTRVNSIEELKDWLYVKYPKLVEHEFRIAVNEKLTEEGDLHPNDRVALLPPYSGG